ncbi:MAG: MotA/TolQ/ExbB proton channel family protein [Gammaproteobacteria bacterium]|nr:MotA/TolQ/ExbB proton channel family protein [Gammaproteobacteria bacterium]
MNRKLPIEFAYQIFALITAIVIVHGVYTLVIRPKAADIRAQQLEQIAADENYVPERSPYILIKDLEQECCFILFFWALAIMGYKAALTTKEGRMLEKDLIPLAEGVSILPEDTRSYSRTVQELPVDQSGLLLPRVLLSALHRFRSTRNIQDVSTVVRTLCEGESDRLDSELSLVRYIAWAIPSIGFIGTVRGIGEALGQAHKAVEGDITGVTASLGVAFNSTFIALLLSIILMFLLHQLTLVQERLVLDTEHYCDERLVSQLQVR